MPLTSPVSLADLLGPELRQQFRFYTDVDCVRCVKPLADAPDGYATLIDADGVWCIHAGCLHAKPTA